MESLVITGDSSHTVVSSRFGVAYHSRHGAISESEHVFLGAGLEKYVQTHKPDKVRVLEFGFGTGLNAVLSSIFAERHRLPIEYRGIEKYPILPELVDLNYCSLLDFPIHDFKQLHNIDEPQHLHPYFVSQVYENYFTQILGDFWNCDVIYYDAFGPPTQPELWTSEMMKICYELLNVGGIWVSYCAKGQVRRDLASCGFEVERLEGPPGKREMLRATKK